MLTAREVGIVAERELSRNLRSTKGIAMFALFFLGGLLPALIRMLARRAAADVPESVQREIFEKYLLNEYKSPDIAKYIVDAPPIIYFLFDGTLMFLPLLVLLVGFDQIVGEVEHRTLRYSAGRATRASIVTGKALGIWGVAAIMISVLHVTVWIIALIQGGQSAGAVLSWGSRLLFFSVICASAYVGFTSIMSALFRTPIVALFVGAGTGFAIWVVYKLCSAFSSDTFRAFTQGESLEAASSTPRPGWQQALDAVTWIFPNRYEKLLVVPNAGQVLAGLALFIVWGGACVALASFVVSRRDV
jgi:ABC-type transport system involved in multi-copper enzyme maturation permease subunit